MGKYCYLMHSAKGTTWKKKDHAYIRKEGNRYIYGKMPLSDKAMRIKSPKNIQPDRGDYLYPKFMYDRDQAKYKQAEMDARVNKQAYQQQLMRMELEDKKNTKQNPKPEKTSNKLFTGDPTNPFATVFSAIKDFFAPSKKNNDAVPGATKEQLRSLLKEVDDRMRFYSKMQLENTSKYQNSSNYKFQKAFSNFIDKGKAFVKNLFNFRNINEQKTKEEQQKQFRERQKRKQNYQGQSAYNASNVANRNRTGFMIRRRK